MIACYILYSPSLNRFYIGATQDGVENRVLKHNQKEYGRHRYTAKTDDWEMFLEIPCDSYSQATRIERHIKQMKSAKYIQNLKMYPDLIQKLLNQYSDGGIWLSR